MVRKIAVLTLAFILIGLFNLKQNITTDNQLKITTVDINSSGSILESLIVTSAFGACKAECDPPCAYNLICVDGDCQHDPGTDCEPPCAYNLVCNKTTGHCEHSPGTDCEPPCGFNLVCNKTTGRCEHEPGTECQPPCQRKLTCNKETGACER
jgi:hypothetical protein